MSENIKKTSLGITGMTCAACSNKVEKNLNKLDEVNANVNPSTEKATIEYNPNVTSLEDIANTIQKNRLWSFNRKSGSRCNGNDVCSLFE